MKSDLGGEHAGLLTIYVCKFYIPMICAGSTGGNQRRTVPFPFTERIIVRSFILVQMNSALIE